MSAETDTTRSVVSTDDRTWVGGVAAGIVAGILFAAMLSLQMTPVISRAIPALYGLTGGVAGWVIHVSHSAVFGVVFAALVQYADVSERWSVAGAGVGYGVLLWVVGAVLVMPLWLSAVGFPGAPPFPNVSTMSLVGHVVFGLVLGAGYTVAEPR